MQQWIGTFFCVGLFVVTGDSVKGDIEVELGELGTTFTGSFKIKYTGTYLSGEETTGIIKSEEGFLFAKMEDRHILFIVDTSDDKTIKGHYIFSTLHDAGFFTLKRV